MAIQPMTCLQSPVPPLKPVKKAEQLIAEGIARQKIIDKLLTDAPTPIVLRPGETLIGYPTPDEMIRQG